MRNQSLSTGKCHGRRACGGAGFGNLLCGVTTVCHHNPYEPDVFTDEFAVRVLKDYGWAHSCHWSRKHRLKKRETPEGASLLHTIRGGHRKKSRK